MKLSPCVVALSIVAGASAFTPAPTFVKTSAATTTSLNGFDLSGNNWKPDSEKMGSTDTGDYYPEGYDPNNEIAFSTGMMGSQDTLNKDRGGPQLPGMENLGEDAVMMGGIEMSDEFPPGLDFTPSSVMDGEFQFQVGSSEGGSAELAINPVCMTYEDYYAAFAPGSHESLVVAPAIGRMDRRGGEPTILRVGCQPNGQGGRFEGVLVVNLPDDNSKICYKIACQVF